MKKYFLVLTTVLAVVAPAGAIAQTSPINNAGDNYFLTLVNNFLKKKGNDLVLLDDSDKIKQGKLLCEMLDKGYRYPEIRQSIEKSILELKKSEQESNKIFQFLTTVHYAAVSSYCPDHYQKVVNE